MSFVITPEIAITVAGILQAPTWTILIWMLKIQRKSCLTLQDLVTKDGIYHRQSIK
jgi:hypothetical protein